MSKDNKPNLTLEFREWLQKQRLAGRRLSIEFALQADTTAAIILDRYTLGTFMLIAEDKGLDVRHMLTEALASTLGEVAYAKHHDGDMH